MIDSSLLNLLFASIRDEWQAMPPHIAPWGVWITRRAPLSPDTDDLHQPQMQRSIQHAWLLQGHEFPPQPRNVWEYIRFFTMHFERPWDPYHLAADPRFRNRTYPLGIAAFAPYLDSQDIYLETIWGGLWGLGRRVRETAPGVLTGVEFLWIS